MNLIAQSLDFLHLMPIFDPMKLNAPLLPLAVCLIIGIVLSSFLIDWTVMLFWLAVAVVVVSLLSRWPRWQTIGIWFCMVLLGMTMGARQQPHPSRQTPNETAMQMRQQMMERYRQWGVSDEVLGVVTAMSLGEKSQLEWELKDTYSKVGAAHILALSGLHLMIIYAFISLFIAWRRFRMLSQIIIIVAIWAFAFLVGMSPSVVRSAFMISIYALLSLGHRERLSVNTLALTAIVMLLFNPQSLYDISFQLSFMAVLAILLFYPLFCQVLPPHILQRHRWLNALWGMVTVSVSAQLGTAPLIAYYFGRFSTYFLLSNFVVVPLATAVLYLTLASVLTGWWTGLQQLLVTILSAVVILMNRLLQTISHLPYCTIEGLQPTGWQVAFLYLMIGSAYVLLSLRFATTRQSV